MSLSGKDLNWQDISCSLYFVKGLSKDCSGNILSRKFTKEGKESLLEALNDVRRTIAYGEQGGQPSAANMKKVVSH